MCAPLLDGLEELPAPQAEALATAFGLAPGAPPDRFLIGLAVLSLLTEEAEKQPLLCLVDDAQWLDQASFQTLTFVARRLAAEPLVMVFATRPADRDRLWNGLPQLTLPGLASPAAKELLDSVVPTRLDPRVRSRILAESRGNPLALLELGRWSSAAELTFGLELPAAELVAGRMEAGFRLELEQLPDETQRLLLVAAAEPLGDVGLLWQASAALGIGLDAAAPAEALGLFQVRNTVRFRHPLLRSAVYRGASAADRQAAHRALAAVTDPVRDPDRLAWHRAQAVPGPDEAVAAELEQSAGRALTRGGLAAAASFLQRSALLSPDEGQRINRELSAAETALGAGMLEDVFHLLDVLEQRPLDDGQRARCELLRAQIAFASNRGGDAVFLLLAAARLLEAVLPARACDTYLGALQASMFIGRLAPEPGVLEVARAARHAPVPEPPRRTDRLMLAMAVLFEDGLAGAVTQVRDAYEGILDEDLPTEEALDFLVFAVAAAHSVWDLPRWTAMSGRQVQLARASGALVTLQLALSADAYARLFNGDLVTASAHLEEAQALAEVSGIPVHPYVAMALAAFRGDQVASATIITPAEQDAVVRREGLVVCLSKWSQALISNGNGKYAEALALCRELLVDDQGVLTVAPYEPSSSWALAELVEAAVRCDELPVAIEASDLLSKLAAACGTDWALGVAARSRALLGVGGDADAVYREAIELLGRSGARVDHARGHLLHGEWLRREGRRTEARDALRKAHESLAAMGVSAFAERARRELEAAGESVRARADTTRHDLTAQELHIARLAAEGRSNPEIAAELYLSRHTIEWHLRKVFAKLDVKGRHQLRDALGVLVA
jgi:DNA-binding CsgD family transcriptional regulator